MFSLQLVAVVLFVLARDSGALKSMRIRVPDVVKSGETVTLSCDYDLEQVALYTIKWYWNDYEFYRYVPKESPPYRAFTMQYINVDISRSGPTQVTLRGVGKQLTGDYKCEVSADGPLFHTDIKTAHMIVVELPADNPMLRISQKPSKLEPWKKISAECISPGSDPPANLTWYINNEPVSGEVDGVRVFPPNVENDTALGLHSSHSRLEIESNREFFIKGMLSIQCHAEIYTLWRKVAEDYVRDETPQLAPVLGSTSSQSQVDDAADVVGGSDQPAQNACITHADVTGAILLLAGLLCANGIGAFIIR